MEYCLLYGFAFLGCMIVGIAVYITTPENPYEDYASLESKMIEKYFDK